MDFIKKRDEVMAARDQALIHFGEMEGAVKMLNEIIEEEENAKREKDRSKKDRSKKGSGKKGSGKVTNIRQERSS